MYQKLIQTVLKKVDPEKAYQEEYDTFLRYENPSNIIKYNGFLLTQTEEKILNELLDGIEKPTVVDVGCADGRRLFPYLEAKNARIIGIEKFQNVYARAPWERKKYIYCLSITNTIKLRRIVKKNSADLVTMLGLSVGGLHTRNSRAEAFRNISYLLKRGGSFLIEAYRHDEYERTKGLAISFSYDIPHQYLPSRQELIGLAKNQGLLFVEEKESFASDHNIGGVFLVFRKE